MQRPFFEVLCTVGVAVSLFPGCDSTAKVTGVSGRVQHLPGSPNVYVFATVDPPMEGAEVLFTREGDKGGKIAVTDERGVAKYSLRVKEDEVDFEKDAVLIEVGEHTARVPLSGTPTVESPKLALSSSVKKRKSQEPAWVVKSELGEFSVPLIVGKPELTFDGVESLALVGGETLPGTSLDLDQLLVAHVVTLSPEKALDRTLSEDEAHYQLELEVTPKGGEAITVALDLELKDNQPIRLAADEFIRAVVDGKQIERPADDNDVAILTLYGSVVGTPKTFAEIDYFARAADEGEPRWTKRTCSYQSGPDVKVALQDKKVQLVSIRDGSIAAERVFKGQSGKCPAQVGRDQTGVSMGPSGTEIGKWLKSQRKRLPAS